MEDIRIGRKSRSTQSVVNVLTTASVVLVPANKKRIALIISNPSADRITLSFNDPAIDEQGIKLNNGTGMLQLSLILHGDIVTRKICAIATVGTKITGVWETFLEDE